jgi:hypothetical protein
LNDWDVSNAKNMSKMFYFCKKFNGDLSKWHLPELQTADEMFDHCETFNPISLNSWNPEKLVSAYRMFNYCDKFNGDLSKWHLPKLQTAYSSINLIKDILSEMNLVLRDFINIRFKNREDVIRIEEVGIDAHKKVKYINQGNQLPSIVSYFSISLFNSS